MPAHVQASRSKGKPETSAPRAKAADALAAAALSVALALPGFPARAGLAALGTAALGATTAEAGDWKRDKWGERRERRGRDRPIYGDGPLPDYIPGVGTYSGGVSAVRIPRHGTYFYVEGNGNRRTPSVLEAPNGGPKVVVPDKKAFEAACDRSRGGVCVIRP